MSTSTLFLQQPQLHTNCQIEQVDGCLRLNYDNREFTIEPDGRSVEDLISFIELLDGSRGIDDLVAASEGWTQEEVLDAIDALDHHALLSDGFRTPLEGTSGKAFLLECENLYKSWELKLGENEYTRLMLDTKIDERLVYGFAFEYFHITYMAHDALAPVISKVQDPLLRQKLIEFFLEEYRHDKFLRKALKSGGFSDEQISNSVPLPYTAAFMNLLASFAHTDPLSFMASLFIYESGDFANDQYIEGLKKNDFPKEFIQHQSIHNDINDEGDHGAISRSLFQYIEYVSPEEQRRVKKNLRFLVEMDWKRYNSFVDYYGNPNNPLPRQV